MHIYFSAKQLAERYSVTQKTIWEWTREGRLPKPSKLSRNCTRWRLESIERFEAEREQAA